MCAKCFTVILTLPPKRFTRKAPVFSPSFRLKKLNEIKQTNTVTVCREMRLNFVVVVQWFSKSSEPEHQNHPLVKRADCGGPNPSLLHRCGAGLNNVHF